MTTQVPDGDHKRLIAVAALSIFIRFVYRRPISASDMSFFNRTPTTKSLSFITSVTLVSSVAQNRGSARIRLDQV